MDIFNFTNNNSFLSNLFFNKITGDKIYNDSILKSNAKLYLGDINENNITTYLERKNDTNQGISFVDLIFDGQTNWETNVSKFRILEINKGTESFSVEISTGSTYIDGDLTTNKNLNINENLTTNGNISINNINGNKVILTVPDTMTEDIEIDLSTIKPYYTTENINDIFGDASCLATYTLDGNADDLSGNYNGNAINVTYADGKFGYAGVFNNSIITSTLSNLNNITTLSFWFKTNSTNKMALIYVSNENLGIYYWDTGEFGLNTSNFDCYGVNIGNTLRDNKWHHVIAQFTNGNYSAFKLYIDNVLKTVSQIRGTSLNNNVTGNLNIGKYNQLSSTEYFIGQIDQVRIFNKTLTSEEIEILYNEKI